MLLRTALILGLSCFITAHAHAQLIVGSDDSNPTIFHIDVDTSAATPLLSGPEADAWGMAYDVGSNTLYWNSGTALLSSPFSMAGLTPTKLGTITIGGDAAAMVGLAFRDGNLLASRNIATEAIYEVDVNTLVATAIYVYPSAFDFGGIGLDMASQRLFGVNDGGSAPSGSGLYEIDTAGQSATFLGGYPAGETDIDGCAAHDGLAYLVVDQPGLFYIYSVATGMQVGTLPSPFTGSAIFSAATYVGDLATPIQSSTWGQIKNSFK